MPGLWKKFRKTGEEQKFFPEAPVGTIISFAGSTAPGGWLDLTKSAVFNTWFAGPYKASDYPELANKAGVITNAGIDYLYLPVLKSKVPIGMGNQATLFGSTYVPVDRTYNLLASAGYDSWALSAAESGVRSHSDHSLGASHGHSIGSPSSHSHNVQYDQTSGIYVGNASNAFYNVISLGGPTAIGSATYGLTLDVATTGATLDYSEEDASDYHNNIQPSLDLMYIIKAA